MDCVLCLMVILSIQEIKAHHASMVQIVCYVDTVDTVDTVVCAAFMQMQTDTQTQCTAYMPLAPPRGKAPCF